MNCVHLWEDNISCRRVDDLSVKATLIDRCFPTGKMAGPKPRIITLTKREGQGYGFYLRVEHGEEGHLIRALEMGGAAELAGLKDGDRIVRVNGTFVDNLEHSQVWCFRKSTFCKSCIIYFNMFGGRPRGLSFSRVRLQIWWERVGWASHCMSLEKRHTRQPKPTVWIFLTLSPSQVRASPPWMECLHQPLKPSFVICKNPAVDLVSP